MAYVILAALWIAWCILHSGMIAVSVTGWLQSRLGGAFRWYRLCYNVVALATFIPLVRYAKLPDAPVFFRWEGPLIWIKYGLLGLALTLFLAGARQYSLGHFLGLTQFGDRKPRASMAETGELHTEGILRVVRHPWYLAALLVIWAGDVTGSSLIGQLILSIYLYVGARLEERKLVLQFGDVYRRYQREVSMLIPLKYVALKLRNSRRSRA